MDALDTEYIWCQAVVDLKIEAGNGKTMLLIHYEGWSRKYDELLTEDSSRLAPKGFYTNREDIPRYKRCDSRNVPMQNAQILGSASHLPAIHPIDEAVSGEASEAS